MNQPSSEQIVDSIKKWAARAGVKVKVDHGAYTRGRPWTHGVRGIVEHHWAGVGDGVLEWMAARDGAYPYYPYCNAAIRVDGTIVVLSGLSAWGSGTGGPWPAAGVPKDLAHLYCWQNEFESWGRKPDLTDAQFTASAVLSCALREVAGPEAFPDFTRLINHKGWTDGGSELGLDYFLPTQGRKNDTLYDIAMFRTRADDLWNVYVAPPKPAVSVLDVQPGCRNDSVKLVKEALIRQGCMRKGLLTSRNFGESMRAGYREWQVRCGLGQLEATGAPDVFTLRKLGRKEGFKVV
jgi:hypothetical protein